MMRTNGTCRNATPAATANRKVQGDLECIECAFALGKPKVNEDHDDGYQRKCRGKGNVASHALLFVNHVADEGRGIADHLRNDVVAQVKIEPAATPGMASGKTIFQNVVESFAPTSPEALTYEVGMRSSAA